MSISSISPGGGLQAYALLSTRPAPEQHAADVPGQKALTEQEQQTVDKLKARDAEVRRHERAHLASAGPYGQGPPKYEHQEGPDGKQYAIGGHVKIDTSAVPGDPEATIRKAKIVKRAALAPQEPSSQDRKIAQQAELMAQQATRELQEQKTEEAQARAEAQGTAPQGYDHQGDGVFSTPAPAQVNLMA